MNGDSTREGVCR